MTLIEEIEEALIKEAKKRRFENIGDLSLILPNGSNFNKGDFKTLCNIFVFYEETNTLYLDGVPVFEDGKWAEIIDDKL